MGTDTRVVPDTVFCSGLLSYPPQLDLAARY